MKGFSIAERGKAVVGVAPVDIGGAAKTSDYWSMENYQQVSIIVVCGVITNSSTIILYEGDDASGSNKTAIAFDLYQITAGVTGAKSRNAAGVASKLSPSSSRMSIKIRSYFPGSSK